MDNVGALPVAVVARAHRYSSNGFGPDPCQSGQTPSTGQPLPAASSLFSGPQVLPVLACPGLFAFRFAMRFAMRFACRVGSSLGRFLRRLGSSRPRLLRCPPPVGVLRVDIRLVGDLLFGPLVAQVVDDLVALAVVLPPPDVHQFLGRFRVPGPPAHVVLGELAVRGLAVGPHQPLGVQPECFVAQRPALVGELIAEPGPRHGRVSFRVAAPMAPCRSCVTDLVLRVFLSVLRVG